MKNRNLLFSGDGAWEEPSNQSSSQKEPEPLYIITSQSIPAVLLYKPNSVALAIYN